MVHHLAILAAISSSFDKLRSIDNSLYKLLSLKRHRHLYVVIQDCTHISDDFVILLELFGKCIAQRMSWNHLRGYPEMLRLYFLKLKL